MFDGIAPRYDLLNRLISLGIDQGWRRRTVDALALGDSATVLDVATGTGDLALEIARRHPSARVVGLDPSRGMLEVARAKLATRAEGARIELVEGDAQSLPFPDAAFDAATVAFGIRNVPDRPRALAELRRVVRPGGRLAVLELSEPNGALGPLTRFHVHNVVPFLGALLSGSWEYRYLQRSIAAFPPPEAFMRLVEAAGWRRVEQARLTFGAAYVHVGEAA
ncbi:MAG: bifunctional demethylmenaquinone methyltransferase/2-methoxy-6-polyprenyl-1,4-benzoquinol methylase UbiE [Polyangiaceae bacterium]|nr:bifunctional demethylmenaquinone methyltransferase/2-methoxy-6-polyprenyl-1,4-benzoquinol methylase UbiE [Polyangiaceae bacterium]